MCSGCSALLSLFADTTAYWAPSATQRAVAAPTTRTVASTQPASTSMGTGTVASLADTNEDVTLARASWYEADMPREVVLEALVADEVGGFLIRDSASHPGCYALSVKVPKYDNPSGIAHYLIQRTRRGVKLKVCCLVAAAFVVMVRHAVCCRVWTRSGRLCILSWCT